MPATGLPFPFGVLIHQGTVPWRPVVLTPGLATAFSALPLAREFLATAGRPEWEVRLVTRLSVVALIEDFRQQGIVGIELDPGAATRGQTITFRDLG